MPKIVLTNHDIAIDKSEELFICRQLIFFADCQQADKDTLKSDLTHDVTCCDAILCFGT